MKPKHALPRSSRAVGPRPHRLALALAASSLLTLPHAGAQVLPSGPVVAAGQAQIAVNGASMTVTNSANTILNWNSFSIGAQNAVRFQQPSATSQVLNRVTGNDPSSILGQLSSNGRVWLLNPNGVLFGQGARIDVAGLVTSTLRLNDQDWLAGRYAFSAGEPGAGVTNQGELRSTLGGRVVLLGGSVRNEGLIDAPDGQVLLAAGESMELVDTGAPNLTVRLTASQGEALNLGTLRSSGGRIDVHAAVVNQQGLVQADGLSAGPGGEIVLQARERLNLADGSVTTATALAGQGGAVQLLGREVGLFGNAQVDASGASGGGEVLVGGGLQGRDASVPNAEAVYFGRDAQIRADATVQGDGGRIILWSDEATRAFGSLSARGGARGGNGGFVETSGGWLDARPLGVDVGAAVGQAGQWLLDPYNITIVNGVSGGGYDADFTATADNAVIDSATITAALDAGTNVTISTGGAAGTQAGDISMGGASIVVNAVNPGSLTLIADADISLSSATIESYGGGAMPVTLLAGRSGTGGISLSGASIRTAGGDLVLGGFGTGTTPDNLSFANAATGGIDIFSSTLDAGAGLLQIHGVSLLSTAGVSLSSFTELYARDIVVRGQSALGEGVGIDAGTLTATHGIALEGTGDTVGVSINRGHLTVAPASADATAALTVTGRSADNSAGVQVQSFTAQTGQLRVENGAILTVRGANVPDASEPGAAIDLYNADSYGGILAPLLYSTSTGGPITVSAFGADNTLYAEGNIASAEASTVTVTADGPITLSSAQLSAAGRIELQARSIELIDSTITSSATGDAIVLRGPTATGLEAFVNEDGEGGDNAGALSTANGRWIVWGSDVLQATFDTGGLDYDFKRYGVADPAAWAGDVGNGLVFTAQQSMLISASALDKVYDGTTLAQLSGGSASGVTGDTGTLRAGTTSEFTDKNAGTGKSVLFPSFEAYDMVDANGRPVYGYSGAAVTTPITASITPAVLSATVTANDKVYDATTQATVSVSGITGLVGDETVVVNTQAFFADKNVGTGKTLSGVQFSLADGSNGGLAANYVFNAPDVSYSADITPFLVTVNGLVAADKVYDTTTSVSLSGTASVTPFSGDQLTLLGAPSAQFSDKNAGTDKVVVVAGLSLGGTDAGNYQLGGADVRADITSALLNVNGLAVADKVYDGTTDATFSGTASVTPLAGDQITLTGAPSVSFSDRNAGTDKALVVAGLSLGGADAGNYRLSSAGLQADITQLLVTVGGLAAADKVYDATTNATLSGIASVTALAGDQLTLLGAPSAQFSDKNVGTGKVVVVSGLSLGGADAANYQLGGADVRADVTPAQLNVNGLIVADKVYDGTTGATFSGAASVTPLAGDQITLTGAPSVSFSDRNAGTDKPLVIAGLSLGGADADNYRLSSGGLQADITPAQLFYVADPATRLIGSPLTGFSGSVTGFVGSDTQADATTGTVSFVGPSAATQPGTYAIEGVGLSAQNYVFAQAPGNAQALALLPARVDDGGARADVSVQAAVQTLTLPAPPIPPGSSGLADISITPSSTPVSSSSGTAAASASASDFGTVRLSSLSVGDLQALLDARDQYKKTVFSESITKLEADPSLADMQPCANMAQAASGSCLVTAELRAQAQANAAGATEAPASAPPPAAPVSPGAATTPGAAASPAQPPAPALPAAPLPGAVAAAAVPAPVPTFASRRRVQTAALPQIERKVALVIGVNRYTDASIPQLGNAVGDAEALGRLFESKLGYETVLVENGTKAAVVAALNRLALELGPRDSALIYYAGHGELIESTGQGYWQLSDSDAKKPETWLSNADIARLVQQIGASQVALISDSCYSGSLADGERIRATPGQADPAKLLAQKAVVAMSSGGNEPVFDEGKNGHSPFAWNLMNSLERVDDWQPGGNVFERVRFAVARELPQRPRYGAGAGHERGADYLFEHRQLAQPN